ncbi:hypothetical protein [Micromonospora tulbaghiae]|uniref:phage terminase small subunit n=1 Tax=Micromonospora tulbaghiae TaxID=479978 RepID=UPI0034393CCE
MPGPAPKHSSTRTRRNRTSTASTLTPTTKAKVPPLPDLEGQPWHPMTLAWWDDLWRSPMAPEYDPSDIHGLYLLATLVNGFWEHPSKELAAEIRLQRQCFGLTPIDRRRLQWEIERSDEAQDRGRRRRTAAPKAPAADPGVDPRSVLRAV